MFVDDDMEYYAQRERTERCLAGHAQSETARSAHLALACAYRRKAMAIGHKSDHAPAFFRQHDPEVALPS
jgi:hypothetical protein